MYKTVSKHSQDIASSDKKVSDIISDKSIDMLNETEHKFFTAIAADIIMNGEIGAADAVRITGKSPQRVRQLFAVLVDKGFLVATGKNKGRKYTFK